MRRRLLQWNCYLYFVVLLDFTKEYSRRPKRILKCDIKKPSQLYSLLFFLSLFRLLTRWPDVNRVICKWIPVAKIKAGRRGISDHYHTHKWESVEKNLYLERGIKLWFVSMWWKRFLYIDFKLWNQYMDINVYIIEYNQL